MKKPITIGVIAIIAIFSIGVDYAYAASVSIPQGTSTPGCEDSNECYIPFKVSISVGEVVNWSNDDSAAHTVTSGTPGIGPSGIFDSSIILGGSQFTYTFEEPGKFDYFCMVHPWMVGIVNVEQSEPIQKIPEKTTNQSKSEMEVFTWQYSRYEIPYTTVGSDFTVIDFEDGVLWLSVAQKSNGYIELRIPREFYNAFNFCEDAKFDVYSGWYKERGSHVRSIIGDRIDYEDNSNESYRIIKINLYPSDFPYTFAIVGTNYFPENGLILSECEQIPDSYNPIWFMISDDTSSKEVILSNTFDYTDSLGYLHISGEIINNQDRAINFVKVIGSVYDNQENFLDSEYSYTQVDVIPPNGKSPFDLVFQGGGTGVDQYLLDVEYLFAEQLPMDLILHEPRSFVDDLGYVRITGEVENRGDKTANFVKIVGALYDNNQYMISQDYTYSTRSDIYPTQKSPYELVFDEVFGEVRYYQIYVESQEYGMLYQNPKSVQVTEIEKSESNVTKEQEKIESPIIEECGKGTELIDGKCEIIEQSKDGGGCLIATATYGSELAPQVQQLRELRENKLLQTESGSAFMESFNDFYYSFSPTIADYERENTLFREAVKITITPMISSLSILNYVDMETDTEVLGYGISLILLNIGMYVGVPAIVVAGIKKKF